MISFEKLNGLLSLIKNSQQLLGCLCQEFFLIYNRENNLFWVNILIAPNIYTELLTWNAIHWKLSEKKIVFCFHTGSELIGKLIFIFYC